MYCNSLDIDREIKHIIQTAMSYYNDNIKNNKQLFEDCYIAIMANVLYSHVIIINFNNYVYAMAQKIIKNYTEDFKKGEYVEKNELKRFLYDAIQEDVFK